MNPYFCPEESLFLSCSVERSQKYGSQFRLYHPITHMQRQAVLSDNCPCVCYVLPVNYLDGSEGAHSPWGKDHLFSGAWAHPSLIARAVLNLVSKILEAPRCSGAKQLTFPVTPITP